MIFSQELNELFLDYYTEFKVMVNEIMSSVPVKDKEKAEAHILMGLCAMIGDICKRNGVPATVPAEYIEGFITTFSHLEAESIPEPKVEKPVGYEKDSNIIVQDLSESKSNGAIDGFIGKKKTLN